MQQKEVEQTCGGAPSPPKIDKRHVIAAVQWVDGTIIDVVHKVK